ncbi:MAG: peptide chain release factor 2 [Bacilli bacterium]
MIYGGLFDLDKKIERLDEINKIMNESDFWNRSNKDDILKENSYLTNLVNDIREVVNKIDFNTVILSEEIDDEMLELIAYEYEVINDKVNKLRLDTYLSGEYDKNDCILEIHSGAGGTESCDWVAMLYRMYTRYLSKNGYSYQEIDKQYGEEVGFKSVMIKVSGVNAYGYLKGEKGVHRLVRISPFDANKRRHTTFASVEVIPEFDDNIDIKIDESDLRIDIFRSSGPGGQGVNTTDSAVRITHIPTGIVVSCQNERSQIRNKQIAIDILKSKLYNLELEEKNKEINRLKGTQMTIGFGSAKRSYVMCPYTLVKDNESMYESANVEKILDGDIGEMLEWNIRRQ